MDAGSGVVRARVVEVNRAHRAGIGRLGSFNCFALVVLPGGLVDEDLIGALNVEADALGGILRLTGAGVEYYSALVGEVLVDFIDVKTGSAVKFHSLAGPSLDACGGVAVALVDIDVDV